MTQRHGASWCSQARHRLCSRCLIALAEGGYAMTMGPVENLVVAFPDGNVSDEIAPELADLGRQE